ncbi:MAG TPA: hypothetical protein PK014_01915 [Thermoanaerobaculia bacterium]|nr:hypothetical protein [Thermoanaerobaculia bacterium]HUM28551.1 hypothetical protein [Thermoanaerobaculia bacterium]HXK66841.1 hypothetical protein [Thermoanaerobaculia bacterium]
MPRRKKEKKERKISLFLYTSIDNSGKKILEASISGSNLREMKSDRFTSQPKFGPFSSKDELLDFIHVVAAEEGYTHYVVTPVSLDAIKSHEADEVLSRPIQGEIDPKRNH